MSGSLPEKRKVDLWIAVGLCRELETLPLLYTWWHERTVRLKTPDLQLQQNQAAVPVFFTSSVSGIRTIQKQRYVLPLG